jgi:hypothetical protein
MKLQLFSVAVISMQLFSTENIVGLGLDCLICFRGQISNNYNYRKKFKYFVKFNLMKVRINLSNMEVYAQQIQNL